MIKKIVLALLIVVFIAAVTLTTYAVAEQSRAASISVIKISFKLDPRLTKGVYMGERWVSPPEYIRVQEAGKELKVEARAYGVDKTGKHSLISPEWKPANTSVLRVSPTQGQSVEIIVLREGQSKLKVIFGDDSRELDVKAVRYMGALRVDISQ